MRTLDEILNLAFAHHAEAFVAVVWTKRVGDRYQEVVERVSESRLPCTYATEVVNRVRDERVRRSSGQHTRLICQDVGAHVNEIAAAPDVEEHLSRTLIAAHRPSGQRDDLHNRTTEILACHIRLLINRDCDRRVECKDCTREIQANTLGGWAMVTDTA